VSRVLVTGATGLIGRRVLAPLTAAGHEVHAVARRAVAEPDVVWHEADLLASQDVVQEVDPEILVHLAWYAEHGKFWTAPVNVEWVEASLALLRAFRGTRAVLAGTCAEYDWAAGEDTLNELSSPLRPATLYGAAKHGLHTVAAQMDGFELAWGRVFFLYGPDEAPGRLFAAVARAVLAGEPARTTPGTQIRDFLHADDVAAAFAALAGSDVTGPVNVASGQPAALRDVVQMIGQAAGRPELIELGALSQRPGEPERLVADVARLRDEVGFAPAYSLREGIERAVASLRGK
jgi:nucleoside-diphosphate-sugar epimerase